MKRVTKRNMLKYIEMRKKYKKTKNPELLIEINNYIDNVINKDKHYYRKLKSYNLTSEQLKEALQINEQKIKKNGGKLICVI